MNQRFVCNIKVQNISWLLSNLLNLHLLPAALCETCNRGFRRVCPVNAESDLYSEQWTTQPLSARIFSDRMLPCPALKLLILPHLPIATSAVARVEMECRFHANCKLTG